MQPPPYPQGKFPRTDSRSYVVDQVLDVCKAVVRGKSAGSWWRWEVLAYRAHYVAGVLLSTSAVGGLAASLSSRDGFWGYVVAIGATVLNLALDLYNRFAVEEAARTALDAKKAFDLIQLNLEAALKQKDPIDTVTELNKNVDSKLVEHREVVPNSSPDLDEEGRKLAAKLVDEYCDRWVVEKVSHSGRYVSQEKPAVTQTYNLTARFQLNPQGKPVFTQEPQDGEVLRSYAISLMLDPTGADPRIERVTFVLDDSYYDPLLESVKQDGLFQQQMESYGDFTVLAKVQAGGNIFAQTGYLSELLRGGHSLDMTPAIQEAIQHIEDN